MKKDPWSTGMSDPKTPAEEAAATPPVTEPTDEHHVGKKGVKDAGTIVKTMGGELMDGRIADITDGDR
jgi:hypothetical protein